MKKQQAHILIAGCGNLGSALATLLLCHGHRVSSLRRSNSILPSGVQPLCGDVTQTESLRNLTAIKPDILVYCVSANAQTDDNYRAIYVDGLRNVLAELNKTSSLRHVFFVSSTRVYGQLTDEFLNEICPANPADFGGKRLLEAENLLNNLPYSGTVLRLSGIYGPGRNRMIKLASQPQAWPKQNSWTNHIHRDDAAAFIAFLVQRVLNDNPVDDCYIVTDGYPAPQYEVLMWLAAKLHIDVSSVAVPRVTGGKQLSNERMRSTGFELQYENHMKNWNW
jgi:nucleoside-diphosphate-sugar epimerase